MSAALEAKTGMRRLADQAKAITENQSLSDAEKRSQIAKLEPQLKAFSDTIALHEQAMRFMGGGDSLQHGGGQLVDFGTKSLGMAPVIAPTEDQLGELHDAILSRKSIKLEVSTKTTSDVSGLMPAQLVPGIVALQHEPTRVLDFIPSAGISVPTWEYVRHVSTTGAPTTVAPGGQKPEVSFVMDTVLGQVRKIAAHTAVEDESLADFPGFAGYVSNELTRVYVDVENGQLLLGDGTGPNILGLLNETGILTRDHAADVSADATANGLDTLEQASTVTLRTGAAFTTADLIVLHPTTASKLRRTKDSQGRYIVDADPTNAGPMRLWGIPVLMTTTIPVGTALVARLSAAGEARIRQGITIETTPYNADDWTHNLTRFRIEARIGLGVPRPSAICKVVGL